MSETFAADDILLQVTPRLPLEEVWNSLTRPEHLEKWLAPRVRVEPREGGAFELFWDKDGTSQNSTQGCRIVKFQEPETIVFTWKGPPRFADLMDQSPAPTQVHLTVSPCPEGIDVTLEHKGWGAGERWETARSWHFHYWEETLHRFREYVMTGELPAPPTRE